MKRTPEVRNSQSEQGLDAGRRRRRQPALSSSAAITASWQPSPRKMAAEDWAQMRSWDDESRFAVHTAQEVIAAYQDGEEAK